MKQEQTRLVVDGNAFYEIDLECVQKKRKQREEKERRQRKTGQRD